MSDHRGRVVSCEYVERQLISADFNPRKTDEQVAIEDLLKLPKGEMAREDEDIEKKAAFTNEVYEDGLKLKLKIVESGRTYERFLGARDLRRMVNLGRNLTREEMEFFGDQLVGRKDPMLMSTFDASVDLDEVG